MGKTRFRGPVVGPLGQYVTINERFGHLALAAECALRGHVGLSAFVVTCKEDEKVPNPDPNPTPTPTPSPSPNPNPNPDPNTNTNTNPNPNPNPTRSCASWRTAFGCRSRR